MENHWSPPLRTGWIAGLTLTVILIAAAVGLTVPVVTRPPSLRSFLLILGACLSLGLAIRVLYQLWGLINADYEMDRNALTIRWGPVTHQVPMGAVRAVVRGSDLTDLHILPTLRWPGYFLAVGKAQLQQEDKHQTLDPVLFFATRSLASQVVICTDGMAYAISPADLEGFLAALHERLEMGPTQDVEPYATHPKFLDWEIWRDRLALVTLAGSVTVFIALLGFLFWRYPSLPQEVILRVTPQGTPLLTAPPRRIFYFPILGAASLLVNVTLGFLLYHRERLLAYFLWIGTLAAMITLTAVTVSVLRMP